MIKMTIKEGKKTLVICSTTEEVNRILEETNHMKRSIFEMDLSNFNLDEFLFDKDGSSEYLILIDKKINYKVADITKTKYIKLIMVTTTVSDGKLKVPKDEINVERYVREHLDEIEFLRKDFDSTTEQRIEIL